MKWIIRVYDDSQELLITLGKIIDAVSYEDALKQADKYVESLPHPEKYSYGVDVANRKAEW